MCNKNKEYYTNFKAKHTDIIKQKINCDLCGGKYTYFNRSHHEATLKHQNKVLKNHFENLQQQRLINQI